MALDAAGFGTAEPARVLPNSPVRTSRSVAFRLRATQDPGLIARIVEPLAKRGLMPAVLEARCRGMPPDQMMVVMQVDDLDPHVQSVIAGTLGAIIGVSSVTIDGAAP